MNERDLLVARALVRVALPIALLAGCSSGQPEPAAEPTADVAMATEAPDATTDVAMQSWSVTFDNHLAAGMPEQDVFLESPDDDTMVVRADVTDESDEAKLAMDVYAASEAVPHDPFRLSDSPLGPFPKGEALGFTLGDWLAGAGTGLYSVENGKGSVALMFEKLVPNGTYTLWCSRLTMPPEFAADDYPCGAADGSENVFTADAEGNAKLELGIEPLLPSEDNVMSVLALAYHSDGESHGASPGDFGLNAHVQLFWMLPAAP